MIRFNVKEAREHLLKHGFVYTIRSRMYKPLESAYYNVGRNLKNMGIVRVQYVCHVAGPNDIESKTKFSGFDNTYKWYELAHKIHRKDTGFSLLLFKVELIHEANEDPREKWIERCKKCGM